MDFPIQNGGSFHSYVSQYQRVPIRCDPFPVHPKLGSSTGGNHWQIHRPGPGLNHGSNLGCPRLQGKNPVPAVVMRPPKMIKDGGLTTMIILYIYIISIISIINIIIIIIDHHH